MKQEIKLLLKRFFTEREFGDFDALRGDDEAMQAVKNIPGEGTIDRHKMWLEIMRRIARRRRRQLTTAWSAAAAVVLVAAGAAWWQLAPLQNPASPTNTPRSVLITTANGSQIDVRGLSDTTITTDSYSINLDSAGSISYQATSSKAIASTVSIPRGEERLLRLPDGTRVWLGSESRLTFMVPFNKGRREVELLGEGYFDVEHDPGRPFTVHAPSMSVTALGTEFNVREWVGEPASATLVQGSVVVERGATSVALAAGEQFELRGGQIVVRHVDASLSGAWRTGRFYFNAMPLGEIARQMERWFDVSIVFRSPELQSTLFTGVASRDEGVEQLLRRAARITPLRWSENSGVIYIETNTNK